MSHGQSQVVTAAPLLHKVMEYETLSLAEELENLNNDDPFSAPITLEFANTVAGLLCSLKELSPPPLYAELQTRKNLDSDPMSNTSKP